MSELDKFNHDDLVDRAARALAQICVPEGPPEGVVEALLAAVEARGAETEANHSKPVAFKRRIFTMKSIMKMAVAACVLLALGLGVVWVLSHSGPTLAFADMADALLKARTVACRVRIQGKMEMTVPMDMSKIQKMLPKEMRKKPPKELPEGNLTVTTRTTFTSTGKLLFLAPNWQRMETEQTGGESIVTIASAGKILNTEKVPKMPGNMKTIQIFDAARSESLQIVPEQKTAILTRWENQPEKAKDQANLFFNMRATIEEARAGKNGVKVDSLGERTIEDRPAVGYAIRQDVVGVKWEFWFDPKTAQTVRIELTMGGGPAGAMKTSMVMDQFRTDMDLDRSLFSLDVPKGYTAQTMTFDASQPTLVDLGKTLRVLAKRKKGLFPDKLPDPKDAMKLIMEETSKGSFELAAEHAKKRALEDAEDAKKPGVKPSPEDVKPPEVTPAETQAMLERVQAISRGIQFLGMSAMIPGTDWHYAGRGVKLGTPDVPIFWYKPAGSEKYKVLYADLSVKELAKDELPKP